jgi:hypothetical protein
MLSYPQWKVLQKWTTALTAAAAGVLIVVGVAALGRVFQLARGEWARSRFETPPDQN